MALTQEEIQIKIYSILAEVSGLEFGQLVPEAYLVGTLGLDSLDLYKLASRLEEAFGIVIEDEEMNRTRTVGELEEMIAGKLPNL